MTVLITGCYGFLGHATAVALLKQGRKVIGIDKVSEAISPKASRIADLERYPAFEFHDINLSRFDDVSALFSASEFDAVVHYAGQYSVMHSTENVRRYAEANLTGFVNVIEAAHVKDCPRFIYASSTFVQDEQLPRVMYGATKEFGERCAHVYAERGMETICLRFASTYGPYCRPDVGIYQLAARLYGGHPIDVSRGGFNYKNGFVFIDDAVEVVLRCLKVELPRPYVVKTIIADDDTADLHDVLGLLEKHSGLTANRVGMGSPPKLAFRPTAKCDALRELIGYAPDTPLDVGVGKFVDWFKATV